MPCDAEEAHSIWDETLFLDPSHALKPILYRFILKGLNSLEIYSKCAGLTEPFQKA
jgi:hypothetical protein